MPAPCKICSLGYNELRRVNLDLLAGMSIRQVSTKWGGLPTGSLTRHRLGHLNRSIRRPDPIDENRTAADVLVGLADSLSDLERIRNDALQKGHTAAAVRATTESRAVAKLLFSDLGLDSTAVAQWVADLEALWGGIARWARSTPGVLTALSQHVDDPRMKRELRASQEVLAAAKAQRKEASTAA